jgi:type I restriction enzyme R subunit
MTDHTESGFEAALIEALTHKGWESAVLTCPTEAQLLHNWAAILFDNNRGIDRLNDAPLTEGEMQQIVEQIVALGTPLKLNGFINGKTVSIKRDNPADALHLGREVSLKIYDRHEIAAGQSRYQIVRQPQFARKTGVAQDRRGDVLLLINGMPVIHIELKRSGVPVSQACNQIEKYAGEGMFSGLFALVQVFVAMQPEETVYFANPGPDGRFNQDYTFHWADFNNEPINQWQAVAGSLLSIPMAHQMIGFYTVADNSDGILKVMRSYQYYAANAISDRVAKTDWHGRHQLGGYIWHTTGSGKTMTSFKSAQLISGSKDADKVVFLIDRIELGTQSAREYRGFADENEDVQETENTDMLVTRLKSADPADALIVTSIQKMSNIKDELGARRAHDIALINRKRIVIIVDEAHRDMFGEMLRMVKETFPAAILFGFTGTPIHTENRKKMSTTSTVFGNELHRYSIADGIRDHNVLGFDPCMVATFRDSDVRLAVALDKAKARDIAQALGSPAKAAVYNRYMNAALVPMAGYAQEDGTYVRGIEDELPDAQYETEQHRRLVAEDILRGWVRLSRNSKFHAIFATASIAEAIAYYRLFKAMGSTLSITALFDPNIDNNGNGLGKEDGLVEILTDYNRRYGQAFDIAGHARFKKDVSARLAHKDPYQRVEQTPERELDLLIVVDQMLTGFDSKWVNTLYLDKVLKYENIIQAFSRTNRLFGPDKPFGTIRYYRRPHTMKRNIELAVKLYSGDKPIGLFVDLLPENLNRLNELYGEIARVFTQAGFPDFASLPAEPSEKGRFAKLFKELNGVLEAARIQGFAWDKPVYTFEPDSGAAAVTVAFTQDDYLVLALRYKELRGDSDDPTGLTGDVPYEIDGYLTEIDTGMIDANYMNTRFEKFLRALNGGDAEAALDELHKSFASLTQEEQKYANIFLHDVQSGAVQVDSAITFRDYVTLYQTRAKNDQITRLSSALGLDEAKLRQILRAGVTERNLNEFGRFDALQATVNKAKAKAYFEATEGKRLSALQVNICIQKLLRKFILGGGIDIVYPAEPTA